MDCRVKFTAGPAEGRTRLPGNDTGESAHPQRPAHCQPAPASPTIAPFSGRGGSPHRRYAAFSAVSPRAPSQGKSGRVSRSGATPEPTVTVRMEENGTGEPARAGLPRLVIALGDVSTGKEITKMTPTRFAFVKANWHADIVDKALAGFLELVPRDDVDVFDVPGAFELPLTARDLAGTGRYAAVVAAALVVDGGIYRHDFVAEAVVNGLMRASLDSRRARPVGVADAAPLSGDRASPRRVRGALRREGPRGRPRRVADRGNAAAHRARGRDNMERDRRGRACRASLKFSRFHAVNLLCTRGIHTLTKRWRPHVSLLPMQERPEPDDRSDRRHQSTKS